MKKFKMKVSFILSLVGIIFSIGLLDASLAQAKQVQLSPMPKLYIDLPNTFLMTNKVNILGLDKIEYDTKNNLLNFLKNNDIKVNENYNEADVTIVLRELGDTVDLSKINPMLRRKAAKNPEGYLLHIEQDSNFSKLIIVEGNDKTGLFYGIQTLKQILNKGNINNLHIEDYPDIKSRGIVEGFYGNPWSHQERLNQLQFYGEHKLNTYIYAPKDDPYHRGKWREPYPKNEMQRMQELIKTAAANKVDFVFAISPGIDINFAGQAGERDFQLLLAKFESLYDMGVRSFAVYYDDIEDKSAIKQALVLNRLQKEFIEKKQDVKPLLTVPTEYFTFDMVNKNGEIKEYTQDFSQTVDKQINVMYTGPGVVCEGLSVADITKVSKIYGRKMAVWWNYPVNDYLLNKLALGPIYGLDVNIAKYSDYFVMNPMEHANLSKITLQTGAEYAWSPTNYNAQEAWDRAIMMQYGKLAADMKLFANHSSYMDKGWAKVGRADAPELREIMDKFFDKLFAQESVSEEILALNHAFNEMEKASLNLKDNLPKEILEEASSQIELWGKLAQYDKVALNMLKAKLDGNTEKYNELRQMTENNLKEIDATWAKVSEKVAVQFIRESLKQ